ncbi:MAG: N-acetylmuramoyl-L-alanine amidase [Candidatus Aminicenantes bacterium]|jgi:N-acetylmuramoyl-L-alanine amidase|nr:N-acetylmuramoyl-L-alanine amidase [Candidatus Aminicenantes bacterium]
MRIRPLFPVLACLSVFLSAAPQDDPRVEIVNLRRYTYSNFTRIVLDMGKLREYTSGQLQDPGRIYVDVLQAKLNPVLQSQSYPVKVEYIGQIRISQKTTSTVRLAVEVDFSRIQSYRVYHLFDPFRLVIDITPRDTKAPPSPTPPDKAFPLTDKTQPPVKREVAPQDPSLAGTSLARQLGLGVRTIVIDPGHGGPRPGTIGKSGLQEKTVNLDVALALQKLLKEKAGIDAILTRESDVDVPLENRTVIANQKRADLFVSIHSNAHRDRKRGGVETFFLNISPDLSVIELAAAENATSTKNIGEMKTILQKIVRNSKIQESRDLAERIQKNLVKALSSDLPSIKNLGVKGGPFWVLIGGEMPSVLVEISHLSNAKEEAKLKTRKYRDLAAQGIYDGIMEYIRSLGKG